MSQELRRRSPRIELPVRSVERRWEARIGHVPYLAPGSAFALEILGTLAGVGLLAAVILFVIGLAAVHCFSDRCDAATEGL